MGIRGRVGRHTRSLGRHCQNWPEDQKTVIGLLNQIDVASGGAAGSLGEQVVDGVCGTPLYSAISRFEDKYFPGQRSGFIDPGGKMLTRMEQLSGQATTGPKVIVESVKRVPKSVEPAPKSFLPDLRAALLDETQVRGRWPAGEQVEVARLVNMAINHVDSLISMGLTDLPWDAELFGRAYITRFDPLATWFRGSLMFDNPDYDSKDPRAKGYKFDPDGPEAPPLPEMKFGYPVPLDSWITTAEQPALLLFKEGWCMRVPPYASDHIQKANCFGYRLPTTTPWDCEPRRMSGKIHDDA